jgi:hypothetical protein
MFIVTPIFAIIPNATNVATNGLVNVLNALAIVTTLGATITLAITIVTFFVIVVFVATNALVSVLAC